MQSPCKQEDCSWTLLKSRSTGYRHTPDWLYWSRRTWYTQVQSKRKKKEKTNEISLIYVVCVLELNMTFLKNMVQIK